MFRDVWLLFSQNNFLWYHHEKLCGGQYIAQITYDYKICLENVEQLLGNDYLHVLGSCNSQQCPQLEHVVHPLDGSLLLLLPSYWWAPPTSVLNKIRINLFIPPGVIILVAMANRFRIHKLSNVDQFVMSYGGLRGAVAFALVLLINPKHVPLQPLFVTTTICVIYFTVFLQGITIKPLVRILNVKRAEKRKPTMNEVMSLENSSCNCC